MDNDRKELLLHEYDELRNYMQTGAVKQAMVLAAGLTFFGLLIERALKHETTQEFVIAYFCLFVLVIVLTRMLSSTSRGAYLISFRLREIAEEFNVPDHFWAIWPKYLLEPVTNSNGRKDCLPAWIASLWFSLKWLFYPKNTESMSKNRHLTEAGSFPYMIIMTFLNLAVVASFLISTFVAIVVLPDAPRIQEVVRRLALWSVPFLVAVLYFVFVQGTINTLLNPYEFKKKLSEEWNKAKGNAKSAPDDS